MGARPTRTDSFDPSELAHKRSRSTPTRETYGELQEAYDHFNRVLFSGELPPCLITLQREKRTCGYFSPERFAHVDGTMTDEIAINPSYFAVVPLLESMQTLVHEMSHLWQHHFGKPGRGRYHNEQWASKLESIGLMPSSTGQPGGKRTGDHMADYPIKDGLFLQACASLLTSDFKLSWYDRFPALEHVQHGQSSMAMLYDASVGGGVVPAAANAALASSIEPGGRGGGARPGAAAGVDGQASTSKSTRTKYACSCGVQVWGKPGLHLVCGECRERFEPKDGP